MDNLKEFSLGQEAAQYMRGVLEEGKTLATLVLRYHNLNDGRVFTYLPPEVTPEVAAQFTTGGKLPQKYVKGSGIAAIPNTKSAVIPIIQSFLSVGPAPLCLFEDASARPSDPRLRTTGTRLLIFSEEVYHYLTLDAIQYKEIERAITEAETDLLIGVMTSLPNYSGLVGRTHKVERHFLDALAQETEKIIVGAYDHEGYLIWEKGREI